MRHGVKKWACCVVGAASIFFAGIAGVAGAQTVTYSLGSEVNLIDPNFYTDNDWIVLNFGVSNSGTLGVFWAVNINSFQQQLFKVPIGTNQTPTAISGLVGFGFDNIVFAPDDSAVFIGQELFDLGTNTFSDYLAYTTSFPAGYDLTDSSVTHKASNNWRVCPVYRGLTLNAEIIFVPILPNGTLDNSREPVLVTNFSLTNPGGGPILLPYVSSDGSAVAFAVWDDSGAPDISDVYVLKNVSAILAAPKLAGTDISSLAPTSLGDTNYVNEIRASETGNGVFCPALSQDGTLVFDCEDFNNVFDSNGTNFFTTAAVSNFDIGISNFDGTGDFSIAAPGNQSLVFPFPSGSRVTYGRSATTILDYRVFAATLITTNDITGQTDPIPGAGTNSTTVGGNPVTVPFTVSPNAVATTTPVQVGDSSGTVVDLPADQVINFPNTPEGAAGAITVTSVVEPVDPGELPDPTTAIPVLRDFGPDGTQFFPEISVTIVYTDAEAALVENEASMTPYLFDTGTNTFKPACDPTVQTATNPATGFTYDECVAGISVDTVNNTLTFLTDHFSTYGIGGERAPSTPQGPRTWVVLVVLVGVAGLLIIVRRHMAAAKAAE